MRFVSIAISLMISAVLFSFVSCQEEGNKNQSPLIKESEIYEKSIGPIQNKFRDLKEAELKNRLQSQLDLRREIDALVKELNKELKECSPNQNLEKIIPFLTVNNTGAYDIEEVKFLGCGFNEEIMDLQVQLAAVVRVKESKNALLKATLLDSSGKTKKNIFFKPANDYPENGKTVLLLTHIEGAELIKCMAAIRFE